MNIKVYLSLVYLKHKRGDKFHGKFQLDVPRDRNGSFEPQVVKKNQTTMSDEIEKKML
jgi:transposase-like protein